MSIYKQLGPDGEILQQEVWNASNKLNFLKLNMGFDREFAAIHGIEYRGNDPESDPEYRAKYAEAHRVLMEASAALKAFRKEQDILQEEKEKREEARREEAQRFADNPSAAGMHLCNKARALLVRARESNPCPPLRKERADVLKKAIEAFATALKDTDLTEEVEQRLLNDMLFAEDDLVNTFPRQYPRLAVDEMHYTGFPPPRYYSIIPKI